ncbi:MAG: META domain-containing protein [bacterium]
MKYLAVLLVLAAVLPPFSVLAGAPGDDSLAFPLPASFQGVLPCADCQGIAYHLVLLEDATWFLRTTYLGRGDEAATDAVGRAVLDGEGKLTLLDGGKEPVRWRITGDRTLRLLDREGADIVSTLNYDLTRDDAFVPFEPVLELQGMYRWFADAAFLQECLTGRRFPVAFEGDNLALEKAFLALVDRPEAGVMTELNARIALRPPMEGPGPVWTVIPLDFEGMWPGETCGNPGHRSELLNTYWKLTRVGSKPVIVHAGQKEAHLILRVYGGQVAGWSGCNRLIGTYLLEGEKISFKDIASTLMACPDSREIEQVYLAALRATASWVVSGQYLHLYDRDGALLARFEARYF